jgi:hypothetical protein
VKLAAATAARHLRLEVHASTQFSGSSHNERIEHNRTTQQTHMLQYNSFRPGELRSMHPSLTLSLHGCASGAFPCFDPVACRLFNSQARVTKSQGRKTLWKWHPKNRNIFDANSQKKKEQRIGPSANLPRCDWRRSQRAPPGFPSQQQGGSSRAGMRPLQETAARPVTPVHPAQPVVWCGVVWCGVVWCGVVWCGVVWCGAVLSWPTTASGHQKVPSPSKGS